MKNGKLGVCVVGGGYMGSVHADRWSRLTEARVVAVVDTVGERARKLAHTHSLDTWYTDYRPAISLKEVDIVSVCIPTRFHPEVTIFAAKHGKHILCEKPIALTLQDAEAMIRSAQQNGVKLGVGFMRRHSPVMSHLKKWISAGHLGRPVMYHAVDVREIRPKLAMHDAYASGGPIIDQGVHLYDSWAYLFNSEPVEVYARGLKLAQGRRELAHIKEIAYDTASVLVRYASGDLGVFVVSWGLPPGVFPPETPDQIFGSKGMAELELLYTTPHQEVRVKQERGAWKVISSSDQDMYELEIAHFVRCILEDQPPLVTGEDGRVALSVARAAMESIQTGQPVYLS